MSDAPDKKHSWAKYRAEPGARSTPKADGPRGPVPAKPSAFTSKPAPRPLPPKPIARPIPPKPAPAPTADQPPPKAPDAVVPGTVVSADLAAALNKLAAEYAAPAVTDAPFVTAMQREEEARERKRQARIRLAKLGALALVVLVALHLTITRVLYRTPSEAALADHVRGLPDTILPLYSSVRQPLQPAGVTYAETDRVGINRIRYAAEVTLRLRKPLYLPASTNGTEAYRQLQESLQHARQRDLKFGLFPAGQGPTLPVLPQLIQMSHRAGEPIVVRVPFEARRLGWKWRLVPPQPALRSASRTLVGESVERYADVPHLVFGAPGAMAEIRGLMRQARTYIVAVAQEVQRQSMGAAVADPNRAAGLDPSLADLPAATDADARPLLSLEDLQRLFDPNAPAVDQPTPPPEATAPAVDPNAPAVPAPEGQRK